MRVDVLYIHTAWSICQVPRCLSEFDFRCLLLGSRHLEIAELHRSQPASLLTDPDMAAPSPTSTFPSAHVFLAVLLLFLYISPTNAFGAGNIGRT